MSPLPESTMSETMLESLERTQKRTHRAYLAALGVVAVLTLIAHGTLGSLIVSLEGYAEVINKAGRQRMLSQRTTMLTIAAQSDPRSAEAAEQGLALFEQSHASLAYGGDGTTPDPELPDVIADIYFGATDLDARVVGHIALLRAVLAEEPGARAHLQAYLADDQPTALLRDLNEVVGAWQASSDERVAFVKRFEVIVLTLTLLVLAGEARWVFAPLVRLLGTQIQRITSLHEDVVSREADLKLILDTVSDGFLTVGLDGKPRGASSARVLELLPGLRDGEAIWDAPALPQNLSVSMQMGFSQLEDGFLPLELCLAQLPSRSRSASSVLEFSWSPVCGDEESLDAVVVRVVDVTQQVRAEEQERASRDALGLLEAEREDPAGARNFLRDGERLLEQILSPESTNEERARDIHTLKGNASLYGMLHFASFLHGIEDAMKAGECAVDMLESASEQWEQAVHRSGVDADRGGHLIELSRGEHEDFLRRLAHEQPHEVLRAVAESWSSPTTAEPLRRLRRQATALVERRGGGIAVECRGDEVRLVRGDIDPLWSALIHILRNAVVHAFPDSRPSAEAPVVEISVAAAGSTLELQLRDNGIGVDEDGLRSKAAARGFTGVERLSLLDLMCLDGLSSRDVSDDLAGRGVGMSAVRESIARVGGTFHVHSAPGLGTRFTIEIPNAVAAAEPLAA